MKRTFLLIAILGLFSSTWAYLSNSYYRDGFINSAMGGLGIRF